MKYKAAIFDMDGTILDTIGDMTDSMNYVMRQYGYPTHSVERMKQMVGNGIHVLIERAVPEGVDKVGIEAVYADYMAYYKAHCRIKTKPYEGIPEVIQQLRERGIRTAVISNKADAAVQELRESLFPNCFDYALGATDRVPLKPERDMVDLALAALSVKAGEAVYIGDSQVDLQTALCAQMDCISVTWGFRSKDFLVEQGAEHFADIPEDILKYFA